MHYTQLPYFTARIKTQEDIVRFASMLHAQSQDGDSDKRGKVICFVERMIDGVKNEIGDHDVRIRVTDLLNELMTQCSSADSYHMIRALLQLRWLPSLTRHSQTLLQTFMATFDCASDEYECYDLVNEYYPITRCPECEEWEFDDRFQDTYNGESVCRQCIDNSYTWSDYYNAHVYSDYAVWARDEDGNEVRIHSDDDDFHYDDDLDMYVHNDYEREPELIGRYHASKEHQRPIRDDWSNNLHRWLGVELEVELSDVDAREKARLINDRVNDGEIGSKVFIENDGSLRNGFEIITQPMSLPAHRDLWQWVKEPIITRGLRSHNTSTCGLHVHVNRDALSGLQIARIVTFINDPNNEQLIKAIARRYGEGYCKIKSKSFDSALNEVTTMCADRYEAVNVTSNKTIEFRIFKGTLKYESLMAAVEFANAMVDFSNKMKAANELTTANFMTFINEDIQAETGYLRPYIEQRLEMA